MAPREVNDEYNKGHSIFKVGVFMAMGVPVLASPVPSYLRLLSENKGGAICKNLDEWAYWLNKFQLDPDLREKWISETKEIIKPFLTSHISSIVNNLLQKLLSN
ncbi:MAG: hypothetical protein N2748_01800 [candidate division WOR-3 bacterium]|nr:hypothetical protein [candidate division WOR-3 bacterium]